MNTPPPRPTHAFECEFNTAAINEVFCCLDPKKRFKKLQFDTLQEIYMIYLQLIFKKTLTQLSFNEISVNC